MDQLNTFTENELENLRGAVKDAVTGVKKSTTKKKLEIVSRITLSVALIGGGVAVTVLFPSPITIAALGGALAFVSSNKGVVKDVKKAKKKSLKAKTGKKELQAIDSELSAKKTKREILSIVNSAPPSAPPMYPDISYDTTF